MSYGNTYKSWVKKQYPNAICRKSPHGYYFVVILDEEDTRRIIGGSANYAWCNAWATVAGEEERE